MSQKQPATIVQEQIRSKEPAQGKPSCSICSGETTELGRKFGRYSQRSYAIRRCSRCQFAFVADPWTDYERIYDENYYQGKGADPLVDYVYELERPDETVRTYEWNGIIQVVTQLGLADKSARWLDFGCGNGGLVRFLRQHQICEAVGFEEGWIREKALVARIPLLDKRQLEESDGRFAVVTAIEVIEHIPDPLACLRLLHRLLKPGGLLFVTTGNAAPWRERLLDWPYLTPETHVSFFEPETLAEALRRAGFRPEYRGYLNGFTEIIRFKILKNFGIKKRSWVERLLPWSWLCRLADRKFKVTAHPLGWA